MNVEEVWKRDFDKHVGLAREKLEAALDEYKKERYSMVGDLAIKAVEQAIEAHAAKHRVHLRDHGPRFEFMKKYYGQKKLADFRYLFDLYGDVGYEGWDPKRGAEKALEIMRDLLNEIEKRGGFVICR